MAYPDAAQQAALGLDDATDAKLITVDVTPPGESVMSFRVVRGNY